MDKGAWQATVHGVAKSWTQLSMHTRPGLNFIPSVSLLVSPPSMSFLAIPYGIQALSSLTSGPI